MKETPEAKPATVRERLPNSMYRVELEGGGELLAHVGGDARAVLTRLVPGDRVLVEVSPTDRGAGRIVARQAGSRGR